MYCIDNRHTDVYFNLAAEEYLMKQAEGDFFMLWQAEPSVVIGKYQSVRAEADETFVGRNKIRLARRFSGGGAVYQDGGNLNLTFIETVDQPDFGRYLNAVTEFLGKQGVVVQTDRRQGIYLDERKVSGSAQCIHKNRVMYHCTLLFDADLSKLDAALAGRASDELLPGSKSVRAVPSVRSAVTNIKEYLPDSMDAGRFRDLIFDHFLKKGDTNRIYGFNPEEEKEIGRLRTEKYATEKWIYNRL